MDEVIQEFVVEANEGVDQIERELVRLERTPDDISVIESISRTLHSIQGGCGLLGFGTREALAHAGESLLGALRDHEIEFSPQISNALLCLVDAIRQIMACVESDETDGEAEYSELIQSLVGLREAAPEASGEAPGEATSTDPDTQPLAPSELVSRNIRVNVELLEGLMNVVGELVLARNQLLQRTGRSEDRPLVATAQRIDAITSELQERVMKTRMQPIESVWARFPRVCRDVAEQCGKRVRIEMSGGDTEMDRTLLEAIRDPLTHLLRNAIDHGIETPAERTAAGKPAAGRITLLAFHESGQVNIELRDDGAGIDLDAVRQRAAALGREFAEEDPTRLVFEPGFSTRDQVSRMSGRGVGMDVVRTNIEKLGGSVDLQTGRGEGTAIRLRIPLTLATIPTLLVEAASECFAIPQLHLRETVRLNSRDARASIHRMAGEPMFRLRGQILPLIYLSAALELDADADASDDARITIVVLQIDERRFGLAVDSVGDTQEIVVKPLGKLLGGLRAYAGATIMGDGRVALILDVVALAQRAGVVSEHANEMHSMMDAAPEWELRSDQLVVFRVREQGQLAIPLAQITRLERIALDRVERAGNHRVIQYRDGLVPLVWIGEVLDLKGAPIADADAPLDVIIYTHGEQIVGLVVAEILDIIENTRGLEAREDQPGILGSTVLGRRVTDVVDPAAVVRLAALPFGEVESANG